MKTFKSKRTIKGDDKHGSHIVSKLSNIYVDTIPVWIQISYVLMTITVAFLVIPRDVFRDIVFRVIKYDLVWKSRTPIVFVMESAPGASISNVLNVARHQR